MIKLKFDAKMIEAILVEKDPEGLIDMGAPGDEYSSEAQMIYNRLTNEDVKDLHSIIVKVVGVFFEMFGVSSACYNHGVKREDVYFNPKYVSFKNNNGPQRLKYFENIAKLIYDSAKKE